MLLSAEELKAKVREALAAELAASIELDKLVDLANQNVATWVVKAEATAAVATATKAAEAGKSHYIVAVVASYGAAQSGGLEVSDGATAILSTHVHNSLVIAPNRPIKATAGNAVSAALGAGAVGVVGRVNLVGFTM